MQNQNILVLDNTESGVVVKRMLAKSGHPAIRANTNQEAIRLLDSMIERVACVVVNIHLAHTSAFEFLYEMRSYEDMQNIPVVVYSSSRLPRAIVGSLDWKLLEIKRVFYKSKHSVSDVCGYVSSLTSQKV